MAVTIIWLPGVFLCKNIISLLGKLVVLVPASWIHKTLQNLSCSYWYFLFPKLFFSPILSRDLITQKAAIWRINNQLRASDAPTWQRGGYQCFLILRPLGEHPDQLQPPFPFALGSSRACGLVNRFIDMVNYNFLLLYASFPTMRAVMPGKMTIIAAGESCFLLSHPSKKCKKLSLLSSQKGLAGQKRTQ